MNIELVKGSQTATFTWDCKSIAEGYVLVGKFDASEKPHENCYKTHSLIFARTYWDILIKQGFKRAAIK